MQTHIYQLVVYNDVICHTYVCIQWKINCLLLILPTYKNIKRDLIKFNAY